MLRINPNQNYFLYYAYTIGQISDTLNITHLQINMYSNLLYSQILQQKHITFTTTKINTIININPSIVFY